MVNVNGRKKKSIISFCLILILLSCMNMSVFASSNDDALPSNGEPSVDAVSLFSCRKNIYGQTGSTLDDLFSSEIMENIQLNIFNLLYTDLTPLSNCIKMSLQKIQQTLIHLF